MLQSQFAFASSGRNELQPISMQPLHSKTLPQCLSGLKLRLEYDSKSSRSLVCSLAALLHTFPFSVLPSANFGNYD